MGRKVDIEHLVDSAEVAGILCLGSRNAVNLYRKRYPAFPEPVFERPRCRLWLRPEVERWAKSTGRR